MRYFLNILLLLTGLLSQMYVSAADQSRDPFIIKHGDGSATQRIMSGDSIRPFFYEYISEVYIDHVQVPDAMFTVNHDKKNRKIHLSGVTGGPANTYEVRIWGLVTNDTLTKERVTRSGKLVVLRPYLETEKTEYNIDTETLLDTIKLNYTKFTYAVWASELPKGMKFVKGEKSCSIVANDYMKPGEYTFKVYGADSLYFSKDSIVVTDGGGTSADTMKFHPKLYSDSITFKINVYEGGLMKIGTGGTKQVVEVGDSIEKFGFQWCAPGKLTTEEIAPGLEMVIDSSKQNIWIQGAPSKTGLFDFDIAYETDFSFTVYNIEVAVLPEIRPILEYEDALTLDQIVSVGEMIDAIDISYYNSDKVWIEGLPKGIKSEINEEDEEIQIYGSLNESGRFTIKVHASNSKYEEVLNITLTSSDKTGGLSGLDDVLSEDTERSVVYDMSGRRVSPENLRNNTIYITKKKIVMRK